MSGVSNREVREYVKNLKPFMTNNKTMFATYNHHRMYVVYSYSSGWPIFVHVNGCWYRNISRYSKTSTAHSGYANPHCEVTDLLVEDIRYLVVNGLVKFAEKRLTA